MTIETERAALSLTVATLNSLLVGQSINCSTSTSLIETVLAQVNTLLRTGDMGEEIERAALVADLMDCLEWGVEAIAQGFYSDGDDALRELKSKLESQAKNRFAEDRRVEMLDCVNGASSMLRSQKAGAISRLHRGWQLLTLEAEVGMNPYSALRIVRNT